MKVLLYLFHQIIRRPAQDDKLCKRKMKTTKTFTDEHEKELKRITTLNVFASKIAQTILSKDFYRASAKQVDILNEVSDIVFYISDDYSNQYMEEAQERQRNLMRL